ncbi:polysialyltransferase family glycosyltransferase [Psittacicella hinzii]|uniref:Uncharacterized protein n=1 Tax=Psittacicella hinzii TaxID=2028575 RepID=A0A3A1YCV1_9GAMM|nr:polysialyltransferase family glycosyltransferase [Psittacicella hinzii]RIY35196.1 hypothetical protein CKF58_06970 [Psittacicella hinzii]
MTKPTLPRAHIFFVHSPITAVTTKLTIEQANLPREDVYLIIRENAYDLVKGLVPDQQILFVDNYWLTSHERGKFITQRWGYILLERAVIQAVQTLITGEDAQVLSELSYGGSIERIRTTREFSLYVAHLTIDMVYALVKSPECVEVNLIEEGTLHYVNYMYSESFLEEEKTPIFALDKTGIEQRNTYYSYLLAEEESESKIKKCYALSDEAFWLLPYYDSLVNVEKVLLDISSLKNPEYQSYLIKHQQEQLLTNPQLANDKEYQARVKDPADIAHYINVVVLEAEKGKFIAEDNFVKSQVEIFKRVYDQGIKYVQYKFHPASSQEVRQQILEQVNNLGLVAQEIPNHVSLDQEAFANAEKQIMFHGIQSSVLLYAAIAGQYVMTYQDILADDPSYIEMLELLPESLSIKINKAAKYHFVNVTS